MNRPDLTRNQSVVFQALEDAAGPLTAYDILGLPQVRKHGLKAPLTIYRALESLLKRGLAHRIESLNAFVACSHAPHKEPAGFVICAECHKTVELSAESCEAVLKRKARDKGFQLDHISIEMMGRCDACRLASAEPADGEPN